jgi:hypothetical protein
LGYWFPIQFGELGGEVEHQLSFQERLSQRKENLILPIINGTKHYAGKSIVLFQVSKEGIVNIPKVIRGVPNCDACDQESIRLVMTMPKMQAAIKNGEAIDSYYSIIIPFNVED